MNDYAGSINLFGSAHTSQSLLDQFSVREIMNHCAETVGYQGVKSTQSLAQREMIRFSNEKTKTDDAMEKLKYLCDEYCD